MTTTSPFELLDPSHAAAAVREALDQMRDAEEHGDGRIPTYAFELLDAAHAAGHRLGRDWAAALMLQAFPCPRIHERAARRLRPDRQARRHDAGRRGARGMTPAELREHAERLVAGWPPLTDEQLARLAVLLRPRI